MGGCAEFVCGLYKENEFIISPDAKLYKCICGVGLDKFLISHVSDYGNIKSVINQSQFIESDRMNVKGGPMKYSIKNLSKDYKKKNVLKELNFDIQEGEILSILGKNGAGKTTLIKILANLLYPTSGEVYYQGTPLSRLGSSYYDEIGVVLEGSRNIYWYMSAIENIQYFGSLYGLKEKDITIRGNKLLKQFGLFEDRNKKVGQFSRGMQQKLAIIISMIHSPKVLFLDEPTLGLDVISKNTLIEEIKSLSTNDKITIILTSHQLDVVEELSDRILMLNEGTIELFESVADLKKLHGTGSYVIECKGFIDENLLLNKYNDTKIKINKEWVEISVENDNYDYVSAIASELTKYNCTIDSIKRKGASLEEVIYNKWKKV
ncbi:hypothetical protein BHF71_08975 [Vulcanibacillus modesticaldus]|uniref:ABC transporter domain-containing protein n=1 Tax=Vulcanibacillus modesticaldus TaxID=337097 RepID=A0A1D2YV18_9BACI|nr:ABC transporter ATP-binding protein [Vulcanibacillus modesticaldus]OEF99486.1 hypothetical protein BHF71_08975 [Vulcanibacillus modesticaldus]